MSTPAVSLDLSAPREFAIRVPKPGGTPREYKLACRRVLREDWVAYFGALYFGTRQEGRDLLQTVETESARVALLDKVLTRAEGYKLAGGEDLMSQANWRDLVPLDHRLLVGSLLTSAAPEPDDDDAIYPGGRPVKLTAVWGSNDEGAQRFTGLVHVLKAPTDAQYRRYKRAASITRIHGGTRNGTTEYVGAQLEAAALYDELIVSVDGYSVNGTPLGSDVELIKREMDTHHKFVAALQVLQPAAEAVLAEKEEGAA